MDERFSNFFVVEYFVDDGDGVLQVEEDFVEHGPFSGSLKNVLASFEVQSQFVAVPNSEQCLQQMALETILLVMLPALYFSR